MGLLDNIYGPDGGASNADYDWDTPLANPIGGDQSQDQPPQPSPVVDMTGDENYPKAPSWKRRDPDDIEGFVAHTTGGSTLEGALDTGVKNGTGAHVYVMPDGTRYRWAPDDMAMTHIREPESQYRNGNNPTLRNRNTLAMEFVAPDEASITPAQRAAGQDQFDEWHAAHPKVKTENVVGHGMIQGDIPGKFDNGNREAAEGTAIALADQAKQNGTQPPPAPETAAAGSPSRGLGSPGGTTPVSAPGNGLSPAAIQQARMRTMPAMPPGGGAPFGVPQPPQDPFAATGMKPPQQPDFIHRLYTNPAFMSGLATLGTEPGGNWGPNGAKAAEGAISSGLALGDDPLNQALKRAQIQQALAHSNYYNSIGGAAGVRAGAVQQNADTKRIQAYTNVVDKLGPNPTAAQWAQESQPGGVLNVAFGGMPPPYSAAPQVLQKAAQLKNATPDDADLLQHGFTQAQIDDMKRTKDMERAYGKPKVGYRWAIDPQTNQPVQQQLADKDDAKQQMRDRVIPTYINQLEQARQVLAKTNPFGRAVAHYTNGWGGYASTKEAMDMSGHAIAQLTALVEGNKHANAQDVRFLQWFQPQPGDTNEILQFKLKQAQTIFHGYMSNKAAGRSENQLSDSFHSAVEKAYQSGIKQQGQAATRQSASPAAPADQGDWKIEKIPDHLGGPRPDTGAMTRTAPDYPPNYMQNGGHYGLRNDDLAYWLTNKQPVGAMPNADNAMQYGRGVGDVIDRARALRGEYGAEMRARAIQELQQAHPLGF